MKRQELLDRIEPIYSQVQACADEIASLTTAPDFDEDYKVERNGDLNERNLDRLHLAAVELSAATDALLGYGEDNRSDEEVADTVTRTLLGLPLPPLEVTDDRTPEQKRLDGDDEPPRESERGIAGDRCEVGNECGRSGCPECQQ